MASLKGKHRVNVILCPKHNLDIYYYLLNIYIQVRINVINIIIYIYRMWCNTRSYVDIYETTRPPEMNYFGFSRRRQRWVGGAPEGRKSGIRR